MAFGISFFTSMGGVSGAFLLMPFQISILGYSTPSVSATNQVFNVVAIPSGVYRYWREGRMVWPLTLAVILGTLPGVFLGAIVRVAWMPDPSHFKLFVAVVLLYIGMKMVLDIIKIPLLRRTGDNSRPIAEDSAPPHPETIASTKDRAPRAPIPKIGWRRLDFTFAETTYSVSLWGVFLLSLMVGVIGGIYGIGGGSIIAPFFITFFALPVHIVAGAALMGTFVTSVAGVIFYQAIAPFFPELSVAPDWLLGFLFGIGGMAGMYLGARCQKYVPGSAIKTILAAIMVFTAITYLVDFFSR
ncbi:MAG TPA: sulfite exporter TauE/SafE family protein [Desulforhopalus sp.]|nr:sulfite exporter TauE/SafE family protein [Desulforhopalus sp.]